MAKIHEEHKCAFINKQIILARLTKMHKIQAISRMCLRVCNCLECVHVNAIVFIIMEKNLFSISINQSLFSIQTSNDNNIHTLINMNTERVGNEVMLLIYISSNILWYV